MRCLALLVWLTWTAVCSAADFRGAQFVGFSDFSKFSKEGEALLSPVISAGINWDELVVSWNLRGAGQLTIEARVVFPEATTRYYQLSVWSARERHSFTNQTDAFGTVAMETLMMKRSGGKVQARVTLTGGGADDLKYLAFSFADTKARPAALEPNRAAWGKKVGVRARSQWDFPGGANWCSPTGYSMVLDFWARRLHRPELGLTVPEMAKQAFDSGWSSAGNWTFNTAVGGHFAGMRSYVTRLTDISELEDWIEVGIPVCASVSYRRLEGKNESGQGHLIVVIGFDKHGDIIANDPGARPGWLRRIVPRADFQSAWADSNNTVYLTYPEAAKIPGPKLGHWE